MIEKRLGAFQRFLVTLLVRVDLDVGAVRDECNQTFVYFHHVLLLPYQRHPAILAGRFWKRSGH